MLCCHAALLPTCPIVVHTPQPNKPSCGHLAVLSPPPPLTPALLPARLPSPLPARLPACLPPRPARPQIAYQKALAATFLEGIIFFLICVTGLRAIILR